MNGDDCNISRGEVDLFPFVCQYIAPYEKKRAGFCGLSVVCCRVNYGPFFRYCCGSKVVDGWFLEGDNVDASSRERRAGDECMLAGA